MNLEKESTMKLVISFYLLAFSISWIIWWPMALSGVTSFIYLLIGQSLGALGPLLSLFALDRLYKEKRIVKTVFSRIKLSKKYVKWFIISSLFPLALAVFTSIVRYVAGDLSDLQIMQPEPLEELGLALIAIVPLQFFASLITSPLFEEPGWRGFVFATLYREKGRLFTSILVGTLWWVWHIPIYVTYGDSLSLLSFMGLFGYSFILDAFFVLSGCNLFVAMLFHQGMNTAIVFFNPGTDTPIGIIILWIFAISIRILWRIHSRNTQAAIVAQK